MKHLFLFLSLLTLASAWQEPKRITRTLSADDAVIIRELGAVIVPKENVLTVEIILGNNEKQDADIQKDDLILMANGTKVTSVKELRTHYDDAAAGSEFKLGVKRGENLLLVKFTRKSEEELGKASGGKTMIMHIEQQPGETVLPALGLKLGTKKKNAVVLEVLPNAAQNFKTFLPKNGDIIRSLNGAAVSSAEEFDETYTELEVDSTVTIVLVRDGKESTVTFAKPKPMGRRMTITR